MAETPCYNKISKGENAKKIGGIRMSKERIEIIEIVQLNRNGIRVEEQDLPLPLPTLYFDDNGGSPDGNFDEDNIAGTWVVVDGKHEVGTYAYRSIDDCTLIKVEQEIEGEITEDIILKILFGEQ